MLTTRLPTRKRMCKHRPSLRRWSLKWWPKQALKEIFKKEWSHTESEWWRQTPLLLTENLIVLSLFFCFELLRSPLFQLSWNGFLPTAWFLSLSLSFSSLGMHWTLLFCQLPEAVGGFPSRAEIMSFWILGSNPNFLSYWGFLHVSVTWNTQQRQLGVIITFKMINTRIWENIMKWLSRAWIYFF